jgi:hypothetical protein
MLERTAKLRQWGALAQGWRQVRRAGARTEAGVLEAILGQASAQERAGVAVVGTADALGPYEEAAGLADGHGLFLVLCEVS